MASISSSLPAPEASTNCAGHGYIFNSIVNWQKTGAVVALVYKSEAAIFHDCTQLKGMSAEDYLHRHWTIYINCEHYPRLLTHWLDPLKEAHCQPCSCILRDKVSSPAPIPNTHYYRIPENRSAFSQSMM